MIVNVGVLLLCLIAILVFKRIAADRAADFMQEFAPPGEGSAEGSDIEDPMDLSLDVAESLIHRAVEQGRALSGP